MSSSPATSARPLSTPLRSPSPSSSTRPMIPRSQPPRAHSGPPSISSSAASAPHRPPRRPSIAQNTASMPISTSSAPATTTTLPTTSTESYPLSSSRVPSSSGYTPATTAPSSHSHPLSKKTRSSSSASSSSVSLPLLGAGLGQGAGGVHVSPAIPPSQAGLASLQSSNAGIPGVNGMHSSTLAAGGPVVTPQTGLGKMAAAAKARAEGGGRKPSELVGGAGQVEEEGHPLSEKSLKARDYQTVLTLSRLFHLPSRWRLIRPLGQGAYGLVIQVQDSYTGEFVAIKCITRVFDKVILARRALREITLLRHFGEHENLTGLIDLDNVWDGYNEIYLYMEPMEADLHQIVRSGQPLSNTHIQYFIYQLLRGMKYIHSANVIHRDLKPGNLLVNADCELKICDFGLARGYRPSQNGMEEGGLRLTEYVATRWYRAPEVMLSNSSYTTAMDVWSIGCILAEVLGGKPLFKGSDYVHQINLIVGALGSPDEATLTRVGSEKACAYMRTLPHYDPVPFQTILPDADPDAISLLDQLLNFDPDQRLTVPQALQTAYVATYHDEADEPSCPAIFDKWEQVESLETIEELRLAISKEIEEFRMEVRSETIEEEDEEEEEEEAEWVYEYTLDEGEGQTSVSPARIESSGERIRLPHHQPLDTDAGPSPRSTSVPLPRVQPQPPTSLLTRERSPGTPLSVFSDDSSRPSTAGPSTAAAAPSAPGTVSGRSSRRTSTHSMHPHRRPNSFLFSSGLGAAMTPLSSMSGIAPLTMTSSTSVPGTGGGHGRSGSLSGPGPATQGDQRPGGRRSRAPSSTLPADFTSLRPLIRQLSTLGMDGTGVGGERDEHGHRVGEVPPMSVCSSDAPPSEAPKSFAPHGQ